MYLLTVLHSTKLAKILPTSHILPFDFTNLKSSEFNQDYYVIDQKCASMIQMCLIAYTYAMLAPYVSNGMHPMSKALHPHVKGTGSKALHLFKALHLGTASVNCTASVITL